MVVLNDFVLFLKQESGSRLEGTKAQGSKTQSSKAQGSNVRGFIIFHEGIRRRACG